MLAARCPRHVVYEGRGFNHAGPGRGPGAVAFVDPGNGQVVEVFFGECVQVGSLFGLRASPTTRRCPWWRVDHALLNGAGPLRPGQVLLLGPLSQETNGPRALGAWPVQTATPARPAHLQTLGRIEELRPGYGFIRPMAGEGRVFFHNSQVQDFTPQIGLRVAFATTQTPRGIQAISVHLA